MWNLQQKIQKCEECEKQLKEQNETDENVWKTLYMDMITAKKEFEKTALQAKKRSKVLEDIIRKYGDYVRSLDRLLAGRWKRGGISQKSEVKMRLLERSMVSKVYIFMLYYQQTVGSGAYKLLDEAVKVYEDRNRKFDKYVADNQKLIFEIVNEMQEA